MTIWCRATTVSLLGLAATLSSCVAVQPQLRTQTIDQLGYFEYREPQSQMKGVVIAAPHAGTAPETMALARMISDNTGAGLVAAYGFESKRISVEQPVVRTNPHQPIPANPVKRQSVFSELKQILREITRDELDFYVGIRAQRRQKSDRGIEAVASGFTFEEIQWIEKAYRTVRDRAIGSQAIEKLPLTFAPIDKVNLVYPGVKHHGVLMIAEKGPESTGAGGIAFWGESARVRAGSIGMDHPAGTPRPRRFVQGTASPGKADGFGAV
jgi:hypothetical protein